jgi:signal transduction histidine kinase
LEQLVYNLVNNAVKYCYRGTRIHLDCKKKYLGPHHPHILTVTDYGMKMDVGPAVYELYSRGLNTTRIEGLGIGLFLVKKIAEAHGGSVGYSSAKVSDYNVPLIEPYLRAQLQWRQSDFMRDLDRELERLGRSGDYYRIVALGEGNELRYSRPTRGELVNSIKKATWEVTFEVVIPPLER